MAAAAVVLRATTEHQLATAMDLLPAAESLTMGSRPMTTLATLTLPRIIRPPMPMAMAVAAAAAVSLNMVAVATTTWPCWRRQFPGSPEKTTPSTPRSPSPHLSATGKLRAATTPILRPSARCSTSAPTEAVAASPNTPSSVPTEPSSTRSTSSVTGGSTLTVPMPRVSTP